MARSTVVALARYPLKSAGGERLDAVDLDHTGLPGDRAWACLDPDDGTIGSAKHPARWGRLLEVRATTAADWRTVEVRVAGRVHVAGTPEADEALSDHLGRGVHLSDRPPADARLHRRLPDSAGLVPEWLDDVGPGGEAVTSMSGAGRVGRFVDFGAVHLVTTGSLARLGRQLGRGPRRRVGSGPTSSLTRRRTRQPARSCTWVTPRCGSSCRPRAASYPASRTAASLTTASS